MCFENLKKKWKCQKTLFENPYYNVVLAKNCGEILENNKEWKPTSSSLDEDEIVEEAMEFQ